MKRVLFLGLGLFVTPAFVSAQVELGLDAGVMIAMIDDVDDNATSVDFPARWARVAFTAGETILLESLVTLEYYSEGDFSENSLLLLPGVNFLLGEQFYVRGEAGLVRSSQTLAGTSDSWTQYGFGGAAGMRLALGDAALLRLEAGADRWMENTDAGVPARTDIRLGAGISALIT